MFAVLSCFYFAEPRFRQSHYDFVVTKNSDEPMPLGKLEAADGDKNDAVSLVIRGAHSHYFEVDSQGMLWMKHMPNVTLIHLIATATDSGIPPRSSTVPVTITMEGIAMAQSSWASGILGVFGAVIALFLLVIMSMSIYIYKQKKPTGKNRVHSHDHGGVSAANLVNHEKAVNGANFLGNSNIRLTNPLNNNNNNHGGSGSSISAGASTILAASLEREAQREREREKDNYTATVRSTF